MPEKTIQEELVEIRTWARNAPGEMNQAMQITAVWHALMLIAERLDKK